MTETHPELEREGSFAHLPLGKAPAARDDRTLRLADYLDATVVLPKVPTRADFSVSDGFPMYDNDRFGDCTCAAVGHMIQAWSAAAGRETRPADADVIELYWATGDPPDEPCEPGGPTDTGRVELEVLNYWRNTGLLSGDKISAYVAVDPKDHEHMRIATYLFGGVYTGIALPRTAQRQHVWDVVGDGKTGDSEPGSWGGHAVPVVAYDMTHLTVVTWGSTLRMTNRFASDYMDEAYALISPDFFAAGKSPAGFDLAALQRDLFALRSR